MDMNDRVLRNIVVGLGSKMDGMVREDHFVITVASGYGYLTLQLTIYAWQSAGSDGLSSHMRLTETGDHRRS